jgi:hypothetical protein
MQALRLPLRRRLPMRQALAATVGAALILGHNVWWDRNFHVVDSGRDERVYLTAADWVRANVPSNAAIVAMQVSGSFFYYTDFPVLRWDHLNSEAWRHVRVEASAGRQPLYAVLFPFEIEREKVLSDRLPGTWVQVGSIEHVSVWQFNGVQ